MSEEQRLYDWLEALINRRFNQLEELIMTSSETTQQVVDADTAEVNTLVTNLQTAITAIQAEIAKLEANGTPNLTGLQTAMSNLSTMVTNVTDVASPPATGAASTATPSTA
jgi:chromosome segregation ATPase